MEIPEGMYITLQLSRITMVYGAIDWDPGSEEPTVANSKIMIQIFAPSVWEISTVHVNKGR